MISVFPTVISAYCCYMVAVNIHGTGIIAKPWLGMHTSLPSHTQVWAPLLEGTYKDCGCLAAKSTLTLCDPTDYSPPVSSVHGISQARILEWVAISYSKGSS